MRVLDPKVVDCTFSFKGEKFQNFSARLCPLRDKLRVKLRDKLPHRKMGKRLRRGGQALPAHLRLFSRLPVAARPRDAG